MAILCSARAANRSGLTQALDHSEMSLDIDNRVTRIYAALGVIVETKIETAARFERSEGRFEVRLDGGMSSADIENAANTAIALVAHLPDHLKRWLRSQSLSTTSIDELFTSSHSVRVLVDLANTEKHGGFDRNGGWSKKQPVLTKLCRGMVLDAAGPDNPASVRFNFTDGTITTEHGSPQIVIDAAVMSSDGEFLGRLTDLLSDALLQLEGIYKRHSGGVV